MGGKREKARKGARRRQKEREGEREKANKEDERSGRGTGSTCLWPARCSKTRWRVDGEATAAERPSCSLGCLPVKAGTLLFTQEDKATANPTDLQRATTSQKSALLQ